ncbi:MAG: flippase-like domain-containing protein [Acidobacteria bacterium]|nr:flippase-like domain-containing protein [Acidobacteriota bacterium]
MRIWLLRAIQAAVAATLLLAVFLIARPGNVARLVRRTDLAGLALAAGAYLGVVGVRSLRLLLILPRGRLGLGTSIQISAVAQTATSFLPARLGELALPALLKRVAGLELASGVGALLIARSLDLAALGVWASVAVGARWGAERPLLLAACLILVAPALLLPVSAALADRLATRLLARRGVAGRRWTRRIRRLRKALTSLAATPGRLVAAMGASLALWAGIWLIVAILLGAIGYSWPFGDVLVGAVAASLATLVPANLIANVGTLEAGWTAGFAAVGIPVTTAAASGIAIHLLSLAVTAVVGAFAGLSLLVTGSRRR